MKSRIKLCLQVAWVTAAWVILLMGFNNCAATNQACFDATDSLVFPVFVLSFPTGFLAVVVLLLLFGPLESVGFIDNSPALWLILSGAGYVQWFVLVPRLFAKQSFVTLGLSERPAPEEIDLRKLEPAHPDIGAADSKESAAAPSPLKRPKPKRVRLIPAYDKRGRTPLERALWSKSTNASA